jgi:hypothetical protein
MQTTLARRLSLQPMRREAAEAWCISAPDQATAVSALVQCVDAYMLWPGRPLRTSGPMAHAYIPRQEVTRAYKSLMCQHSRQLGSFQPTRWA